MSDTELTRAAVAAPASFEHARAVADAVLYEGYLLYPYRKSSGKNAVRWQFGVLAPRRWIEARGPVVDGVAGSTESWWQQTECLLEAPDSAVVHLRVRYLQQQSKSVEQTGPEGRSRAVERLDLGTRDEVAFDEAVPREADVVVRLGDALAGERCFSCGAPGGEEVETAYDDGRDVGRVRRRRWGVTASIRVTAERAEAPFPLYRLRVRVENTGDDTPPEVTRPEALRRCLIATHSFVAVDRGALLSLLDPPVWATPAVQSCANVRTFPVLAGDPVLAGNGDAPASSNDLLLSSPIILYDHPQVAPESPGDLHDATEIDEILSLRTLTLTEEEKREARGTDARAAAIVDRVDTMPPEIMERLHGAVRSLTPSSSADRGPWRPDTPWWDPGADASVSPETDHVVVDGVHVAKGSRVRLRPRRRGTDAHDMFLAGRTARVEAVLLDVDDAQHVAVTIEDDPSAEMHQWYGRFHYFTPEEVEPVADEEGGDG